jgi:hypothetical protein
MKKTVIAIMIAVLLSMSASTVYAADKPIIIDGVTVASDVKPELKNQRMMVPVRVISENLGASVEWLNPEVVVTKGDLKVTLSINSSTAQMNADKVQLDVRPYKKNNRVFVPLRFIAQAFGCNVNYANNIVTVDTPPLLIDGVQVGVLQHEYHMTMGGVVSHYTSPMQNQSIYHIFAENKGDKVEAPKDYSWRYTMDILGSYYKGAQFDFLDQKGKSLLRYDVYSIVNAFPAELLAEYPPMLLHDVTEDQWYLFNDAAWKSIYEIMDTAKQNGYEKEISNTIV